ncbi:hypothetical protein ES703_51816 [subsurface metagenome]
MQKVAFILIGIGILVLIGWSVKGFFMAACIPLLVRIATGAAGVGVLILVGIVIKDRLAKAKTDKFKGVER